MESRVSDSRARKVTTTTSSSLLKLWIAEEMGMSRLREAKNGLFKPQLKTHLFNVILLYFWTDLQQLFGLLVK